jgi:hypothetical protein
MPPLLNGGITGHDFALVDLMKIINVSPIKKAPE